MKIIASFFYVGFLRPAPGTWGTLAALPFAWGIHTLGGFWFLVNMTVFAFLSGLIATQKMTQGATDHDPSWIVIDEVVGIWIALLPMSWFASRYGIDISRMWPGWVTAFVLFRLFDIWKPGPVGWADRMGTPLGVMLDDVIAGVLAAVGVGALAYLAHSVIP